MPVTQPTAWRSSGTMPTPAAVTRAAPRAVSSVAADDRSAPRSAASCPASTAAEFALAVALDAGQADDLAAVDAEG